MKYLGRAFKISVLEKNVAKEERFREILALLDIQGKVSNNDVERFFRVSNSTAERYLNELEGRGKIRQIGKSGRAVHYEKA